MGGIREIIDRIKREGISQVGSFRRVPEEIDLREAMELVQAIGQQLTPRFVLDESNRFAYLNFVKWLHADPTMAANSPLAPKGEPIAGDPRKGIYLAGPTGSGKTICLEVMRLYALELDLAIELPSDSGGGLVFKRLGWINHRADDISSEYMREGSLERYKRTQILGIQDLGQEPEESLYMGNRIPVLRQLLEYRGDKLDAITLITSNLPINDDGGTLRKRYGDRVHSRLHEICNYIVLSGLDRRKSFIK